MSRPKKDAAVYANGHATGQDTTFEHWKRKRSRRSARQETLKTAANAIGFLIVQVLAVLQFAIGPFRATRYSDEVVNVLLVIMATTLLGLFVVPERTTRVIGRFMHATGQRVTDVVVSVLLAVLYLASMPFARFAGRRGFLRRHPGGAAWVDGSEYRNRSTWVAKVNDTDQANVRHRRPVSRAVMFFVGQRSWFLLVVVLVLLLIGSFLALASSPVVAPFVYPLF
jgi:hypothetical protein